MKRLRQSYRSLIPSLLLGLLAGAAVAGVVDRGWSEGQVAANAAAVLTPAREPVALPEFMVDQINGPTLLWYFNPNCGHCQASIAGVVALAKEMEGELAFVGVASVGSTPDEMRWFMDTYKVNFPLVLDQPRGFAYAVGARSTPTALVFEPDGAGGVVATDAYYPWFQGAEVLVKIRRGGQAPFTSHFKQDEYVGDTACSACHSQEAASWGLSHHSVAYRSIYMAEKTQEPECVRCHVTGLGEPTGFVLGEHSNQMSDVGCEACHSAGGPHDGSAVVASEQCVGCHDAEHSINFSVDKGLPHIDHFLANSMSEAEKKQRYQELASGEAPKPLLAFPEGENLAPKQCESCHAEAAAAWSEGPHAGAMGLLKRKQRENLECVGCHATSLRGGAPPTELSGFDLEQGVGCASCHGPGAPHLASPAGASIEGLGEDCPVCVIEAVCTGCHDSKQDPDWDLESALAKQKGHFHAL